jgi:L-seryl-tRNA(Ser) seleniumtransferase
MSTLLRQLPQVDALLASPGMAGLLSAYSRQEVADTLRSALQALRADLKAGRLNQLPDFANEAFAQSLADRIEAERQPNLRPAINATGIIIHTNLGRARLAPEALAAIQAVGAGHSNLELDLDTGRRGSRHTHVEHLICELTGAEAALVVNNCAAAVLLSLMATAQGRKVVASRGELIEIGGAFRLPDVIQQSGAVLSEVGTTNKTRAKDYAEAIDPDTAVLLKSHTSNYQIVGFTHTPGRDELAALAHATGTILMEDLGSGVLVDLSPYGLRNEPVVSDVLASGVDIVMFSGDKLLGGPQCGIIAGRAELIRRLKTHDPFCSVPVLRAISQPVADVRARAEKLAAALTGSGFEDVSSLPSEAFAGGGSLPQQHLKSYAVSIGVSPYTPDALAAALRKARPPVIGMIRNDRFLMDVRTLTDGEVTGVVEAFRGLRSR